MPSQAAQIRHQLMLRIDEFKPAERVLASKALAVAEQAHAGQFRKPPKIDSYLRDPYVIHPMRVALILFDELKHTDIDAVCTALLHDVVEDSDGKVTTSDLEAAFGRTIALMVSVLTKPPKDKKIPREEQLHTYHGRIAQSALSTRLVKLSDRLDNIREASKCSDEPFQQRYLAETREIYLPLAKDTSQYMYDQISKSCSDLELLLKGATG